MGPKKAKGKMPVDGVDTTSMSREQLEAFCIRLREELDREREERNFFQLERDKLRTFWEITRQQLEESRAQQRNQDRAVDELEEKHQAEIKVYKQKVKHLLYEHQCNLSELQVEGMVSLKQAQDDYSAMEQQLLKDKKELKEKIHDMELEHLEEIKQLKIEHSAEVSRIREQLESDSAELEKKYEARLTNQAEEQAMREKMEQAELETRKNQHIVDLTKQHEAAFQEMKNYYNDITLNNLALISTLKEQIEELKANHDRMEKQLTACQAENKKLAEPLQQSQSELGLLRRQLTTYEQDKITLANTKQRLALVTKELEDLRWENDVLELRFEKVEKERDRLHAEFVGAVLDVQQKTGLKGALLEKRMTSMRSGVSQRTAVSVTGCKTQTNIEQPSISDKYSRPTSAPLLIDRAGETRSGWDRFFISSRCRAKSHNDEIVPKRSECRGVKGRGQLRRPQLWERSKKCWIKSLLRTRKTALVKNPLDMCDGWAGVFNDADPPRTSSRVVEPEQLTKRSSWATSDLLTRDENIGLSSPTCICGQHANGCRVTNVDSGMPSAESINLSFDYLARNYTKHRYYPQILDCVRHSLSPIHSQEHGSEASINDNMDKPAKPVPHQVFREEDRRPDTAPTNTIAIRSARPLSASRSDGRDRAFKEKPLRPQQVSRANTTASLVFSKFIPLPPRPDLPWLHGVKSRCFSANSSQKKRKCIYCNRRPTAIDIEIQTSQHLLQNFSPAERECPLLDNPAVPETNPTVSNDSTPGFVSHILKNPFHLSYAVAHMDRNYAAIVTSPKVDDRNATDDALSKTFVKTCMEDCASFGPLWLSQAVNNGSLSKRNSSRINLSLSVSPLRFVDIESDSSDTSTQAMNTPIQTSFEDTGTGLSSLSTPSKADVQIASEHTNSIDVENSAPSAKQYLSSRDNSVERKHERTPLKRKFKATVLRRLKLKLMICSYMHRHDEEGDVKFVHPSARKRLLEPMSLHRFENKSYMPESSFESGDTKYPLGEDSLTAILSTAKSAAVPSCSRSDGKILCSHHFCCVCQSEVTSSRDSAEKDQLCCDECQRKADALLGEYERSYRSPESFHGLFDDSPLRDVFPTEKIMGESLRKECEGQRRNAQIEYAFSKTRHDCDELSSNVGSEFWERKWREGDSFDTDHSSNYGDEISSSEGKLVKDKCTEKSEDDVTFYAKQFDDSCKTVFKNQANTVVSEAGLVNDSCMTELDNVSNGAVSRTGFFGDKEESSMKRDDGRDVLFTLSAVQTAIRSAMRTISPIKPPGCLSPVESSFRRSIRTPDNYSRQLAPTISSSERFPSPVTRSCPSLVASPAAVPHNKARVIPTRSPPQGKLENLPLSLSISDTQQQPNISTTSDLYQPQEKFEDPSSSRSTRDLHQNPYALSNFEPPQRKLKDPSLSPSTSDPHQLPSITPETYTADPLKGRFDDPTSPQAISVTQQQPTIIPATTEANAPQGKLEDLPPQLTPELHQYSTLPPAISDLDQSQRKLEGSSDPMTARTSANFGTSTKPLHVCPLAVPRGVLKGNQRKLIYTEFPVRTYDFPANKLACVSKPKNMFVFYEVSKLKNKSERIKTKVPGGENETFGKDPSSFPRVSRVDTRQILSSRVMLRPSRSSLLVSEDTPIVDIHQEVDLAARNERLKSTGASANFDSTHTPADQKRRPPKFSDGRFDLLVRRRRESWILSDKSSSSKEVTEGAKSRHRSEKQGNEDDVRLSSDKESLIAANRDKRCQCLKRGRKCNCSLTNHLHIRSLNFPRQLNTASVYPKTSVRVVPHHESSLVDGEKPVTKYKDCSSKKGVSFKSREAGPSVEEFRCRPSQLWDSSVRVANFKAGTLRCFGRPGNADVHGRQMATLVEDSSEALFCQEDGSAVIRSSEVKAPIIPTPPPPSPNTTPCSPPSTGRRDLLLRRHGDRVSLRETLTLEDQSNNIRHLPPLPSRRRPHS